FFFFFQAEDGIRDLTVTGVQTCALPILTGPELERLRRLVARFSHQAAQLVDRLLPRYRANIVRARASFRPAEIAGRPTSWRKDEIGRASCRERCRSRWWPYPLQKKAA